jgi:hypothetical protein
VTVKPRPNHAEYLRVLRRMTPDQRLRKAFELGELSRALYRDGLRKRHPELDVQGLQKLLVDRLLRCHNRNY